MRFRRPLGPTSRDVVVYASAIGQADNIGDSLLRRAYLDSLRKVGTVHVLLDVGTESYERGLALHPEDVRYFSRSLWLKSAWRSTATKRVVYAYSAGEMDVQPFYVRSYLKSAALVLKARLSGGSGVHLGLGMRVRRSVLARILGFLLLPNSMVRWRDRESAVWSGVGKAAPDWGFALGGVSEGDISAEASRNLVAISMRGDRGTISPEWISLVSSYCSRHSLTPIVVEQVRSDESLCVQLSKELGAELISWGNADNLEHENRLRGVYRNCAAVISNRLHVLVAGVTEGAVPIGLTTGDPQKLERTFGAAGFASVSIQVRPGTAAEPLLSRMAEMMLSRGELVRAAIAARRILADLESELVDSFSFESPSRTQ